MKFLYTLKQRRLHKRLFTFLDLLVQLEPTEALGVAKALNLKFMEYKGAKAEGLSFDDILSETVDGFIKASKRTQKRILKIMKAATK